MKLFLLFLLFFSPFVLLSNETENLDKELYKACETSMAPINNENEINDELNAGSDVRENTCRMLLDFKAEQSGKKFTSTELIYDESKQYHIGMNLSYYRTKTYSSYYDYEYSEYKSLTFYLEYRIHPILYIATRFGNFQNITYSQRGDSGIIFHPYLRFSPFIMLKYIDFGVSSGFLTYYINETQKDIFFTFDIYFGFKIANFIRINFEAGTGSDNLSHFGLIMGVLF